MCQFNVLFGAVWRGRGADYALAILFISISNFSKSRKIKKTLLVSKEVR
jgi:hypothetical protein